MTSSQSHLSHPKYRPDIDGLRAIAVVSVVTYHAFPTRIQGGFIGVDIFFVISGFLISTIIFENLDKGTFSFAEFYSRRIKRIFPALLLVLTTSYVFGWFFLLADEYKQLGKHIAAGMGFLSNFILWSEAGYFDSAAETKPLLHLWSLGIEEQFYLVWPFLVWIFWHLKLDVIVLAVCIAALSFFLNMQAVTTDPVAAFYSPQTRFWELLSGSILAWSVLRHRTKAEVVRHKLDCWFRKALHRSSAAPGKMEVLSNILSASGVVTLVFGFIHINKDLSFPGAWAVVPVSGAVLMIMAGQKSWINKHVLSNRFVIWLGLISFPLYLWHWPLLSFARIVEREAPDRLTRSCALILSVILAWMTYRFLERPIRSSGRNHLKVSALSLMSIVIGATGYITYSHEGLTFRKKVKDNAENTAAFDWPKENLRNEECLSLILPRSIQFCLLSKGYPVTVALIGDSHANAIYGFFKSYFNKTGDGVIMLGKGGCPPFLGVERDNLGCPIVMEEIIDHLEKDTNIKSIYITGRFAATLSGINFGNEDTINYYSLRLVEDPSINDRSKIFSRGLSAMIDRLNKAGKKVTVILDLPELNFDPKSCLTMHKIKACAIDKKTVVDRQKNYRSIIKALATTHKFYTIDLMEAFCDEASCLAKHEGKVLYRDTNHLGIFGSPFLLKKGLVLN